MTQKNKHRIADAKKSTHNNTLHKAKTQNDQNGFEQRQHKPTKQVNETLQNETKQKPRNKTIHKATFKTHP